LRKKNETLQTVRQMQKKFPDQVQFVTLLTFDSGHTTWHYDDTPALKTRDLSWRAYNPGGGTPLYDAIGKGISKVMAQTDDGDHVLVTIITDGEENSSEEWTLKMVRAMIEKLNILLRLSWRKKGLVGDAAIALGGTLQGFVGHVLLVERAAGLDSLRRAAVANDAYQCPALR